MAEHMPDMGEALGSIPVPKKMKQIPKSVHLSLGPSLPMLCLSLW